MRHPLSERARLHSSEIGTLWRHTAKAIKRGCPADRVFAVTGTSSDETGEFLVAWKLDERDGDLFFLGERLDRDTLFERLWVIAHAPVPDGFANPTPTACFAPGDSFYERVRR